MKELSPTFEKLKAESILSSFQDSLENTNFKFKGVFSRNYNDDIVEVEVDLESKENQQSLSLSRDSLFHILPEGLFFKEDKLKLIDKQRDEEKFKAEAERITKEKQKFLLFFHPFDKSYFKLRFDLEKKLNEIAQDRTTILLDKFFDVFNINKENKLIKKITKLLPLASEIKGNMHLCKDVLKIIFFPAQVDVWKLDKRISSDHFLLIFKSNIHIEKLSPSEFRHLKKEIDCFSQFFHGWFLPVDMGYELKIKDTKEKFVLGKPLTLDYNTYLKG